MAHRARGPFRSGVEAGALAPRDVTYATMRLVPRPNLKLRGPAAPAFATATSLTRRDVLTGLAVAVAFGRARAAAASATASATSATAAPTASDAARALLDDLAWQLLDFDPTQATALGVDTGAQAALRGRLHDRSLTGVEKQRAMLVDGLRRVKVLRRAKLDAVTRTSLKVVESAFGTALEPISWPP